ncbi:MAG: hypothetical protein GY859_11025, partial [Desulfobacterales bacterium]|nr:hypothetical protein [Desulfobacterales bacterium]
EKLRELVFHAALDPTLFQNLLTAAPPGLLLKALASGQGARANIRHARRMDRIIAFIQSFARDKRSSNKKYAAMQDETDAAPAEKADELFARLREDLLGPGAMPEYLARIHLQELFANHQDAFLHYIRENNQTPALIQELIKLLPEPALLKILHFIAPAHFAEIIKYTAILENAARQLPATETAAPDAGFKWSFLFRRFSPRRPGAFDLSEFIKAYTAALAGRLPPAHQERFTAQLNQKAAPAMRNAGAAREWLPPLQKNEPPPPAPAPPPARPLEEDFTEEIFIYNSGIVLASPWLPRLMTMLHLTEK